MSRFRGPPRDTDRRPYFHHEPPFDDRVRPFRAPPGGDRPSWADRPDWPHRPPADWPPPPPAASDWPPPRPAASHWSPDGALSVLSSCGLDAGDLSLLSELPEDMLTLKSLPQLLSQIKQKKDPYLPPGLDPLPPIDQSQAPYPRSALGPPDTGLYREPGPSQSAFVVDYEHRTSDLDYRSKSPERFSALGSSADRGRSFERKPPSVPSETQARDFHGTKPTDFPYSCSLCDITVLSENVWTQHINTTLHADRQLSLLQRFPKWDCRVNSARRDGKQSAKQEKRSSKREKEKEQKQIPKKGKVVCVKFPARAVDESYLRNLTKDFGHIVNVAMFPSLGFIEMETPDQASNLIASFSLSPHKVEEQELEFTISTTFNFLQSSFVLNFFPVPFGNDGKRDLLAIIRRFGTPLYTMFITDTMHAYIEMQNAADAHKMVEYYSTTPLKMNGVNIIVSFSQEFRTLARCARAKPYEENEENKPETATPKTTVVKKKTVKKAAAVSQAGSEAPSAQSESEEQKKDENTEAEAKTEDGKEPSEGGSDMEIDGVEVVGAKLDDEEDSGLPPNLDNCITLDEVSDNEDAAVEAPVEEEEGKESEDSPRVVYIGNLPLCRFSDPQFIKMVQLVHRPVRYFINRQQRMGLAEFASRTQAREFVAKMQDYSFGGCCLTTFISNKYNRLPWGRGVEYDEHGRIMRHFRIGKSPEREKTLAMPSPPRHSRRRSKDRDSPRAKKHRERSRSRGKSRARSRDRSRGKPRPKSRERSRDRSRAKSRPRSKSRDRSRGKSKGRSRERSRERSRGRSRGRSRSRARSRDRREKSRSPTSRDKPPPSGEASKEAESAQDKGVDIRIENVVSLKSADPGEPKRDQAHGGASGTRSVEGKEQESQEEGWTVANLNTEEEAEKMDEGEKRKVSGEEEEEKRKDDAGDGEKDSTQTAEGATEARAPAEARAPTEAGAPAEARAPTKPVGTEFIRFYCALCHVMYSEQQEAQAHCSTVQHYHKYKEMTGKDPWSS